MEVTYFWPPWLTGSYHPRCVDAVMRLKGSTNLDMIQIIKRQGGTMTDSYLDEGFLLNKSISGSGSRSGWRTPGCAQAKARGTNSRHGLMRKKS